MSEKIPRAVLISDLHYNIKNLDVADKALRLAIDKAAELNVELVIAGDLNDTKAMMRAEVVNQLLDTQKYADAVMTGRVRLLVGNHDLINERGSAHSLNFLDAWWIHDEPHYSAFHDVTFLPYTHDFSTHLKYLKESSPERSLVIMHQGVKGAYMGEYIIDKSSVDPKLLEPWRCISGHYHRAQTIGNFSYIGSPYTTSFAEANDGPKGFHILYSDGSMEQVPTNLRKHLKLSFNVRDTNWTADDYKPGDLVWVKIAGPQLELDKLDKKTISETLFNGADFKLELVPDELFIEDSVRQVSQVFTPESSSDLLDSLISDSAENEQDKVQLKSLFREIM